MTGGHGTVVVVRLDSDGDVLLAGPAIRAVARRAGRVVLLVSPSGRQAAAELPGVDEVVVLRAPWTGFDSPPVDRGHLMDVAGELAATGAGRGVILTSFHQSSLPAALLLRLAGVGHITGISEDYPGSLLDVRVREDDIGDGTDLHEVERALAVVAAAGYEGAGDPLGDRLAIRPVPRPRALGLPARYVVVHPSASVPARAPAPHTARSWVHELRRAGHEVVVTGGPGQERSTAAVAVEGALDLGGRTSFSQLAAVLAGADAVVVGNTGPAHLAAAVGVPVVSAFAPVVPWRRWRPWGVPTVRLGDQAADCAASRARACPVPGHPCLDVPSSDVVAAVRSLARSPEAPAPTPQTTGPNAQTEAAA